MPTPAEKYATSPATLPFNGSEIVHISQGGVSKGAYLNGGVAVPTTSYSIATGVSTVLLNAASGTITVPADLPVGTRLHIEKISASAGTMTIARSGSETFQGATSLDSTIRYGGFDLVKDTLTVWKYEQIHNSFIVAGVMRYYDSIPGWDLIDNQDGNHPAINVESIDSTTTPGRIDVNFTQTGTGVNTFVAVPDEDLSNEGIFIGISTDFDKAKILIYRNFSDYIYYDGATWQSFSGKVTLTWNTDHLEITGMGFYANGGVSGKEPLLTGNAWPQLTARDGGYIPNIAAGGALNQVNVTFYNYSGTKITTPDTSMKFYCAWNHPILLDPNNMPDQYGNIWFYGVLQK